MFVSVSELTAVLDEQLLRLDETARLLNISITKLQRLGRDGKGPPALRWGRKCTRYQLGMIRRWLKKEHLRALEGKKDLQEDNS
ncbi:MAG: helix-turn-helix domain-containing protein [Xanthobacteraceae bacterium]